VLGRYLEEAYIHFESLPRLSVLVTEYIKTSVVQCMVIPMRFLKLVDYLGRKLLLAAYVLDVLVSSYL
jgi:hypothetical protein